MSDTDHARGTVPLDSSSLELRHALLRVSGSQAALMRDQLHIARVLCRAEAAYVSIFAEVKEVLIAKAGALPREIPYRASQTREMLADRAFFESLDLLSNTSPVLPALLDSPWYYRYCALIPLSIRGVLVGAIGVLDRTPHSEALSEETCVALRALARVVAIILSDNRQREPVKRHPRITRVAAPLVRHAASDQVRETDTPHAEERDGLVGFFEIDASNGTARISPSLCRILALPVQDVFPVSAIKPCFPSTASRRSFLDEITLQSNDVLDYKIRLSGVVSDRPKWLQCQIGVTRDDDGHLTDAFGVVLDASYHGETVRNYTLLALLGKELRNAECSEDAFRIASRYLGMSLGAEYVRCFYFEAESGKIVSEFDGWSRNGAALSSIIRPTGSKIRRYLSRGMSLAIDDLPTSNWLLVEQNAQGEPLPKSCLVVPSLSANKLLHCVLIQSANQRLWCVEDTHFARIVIDWVDAVSDLMEARRGQEFLYREMVHRLKNTLTVVQALARQSLRDYPDQSGVKSFERRVHALASANASSMSRRSKKAEIEDIARDVLQLIAPLDRFKFAGPKVSLRPKTAGYLGLLLNELGTNAIKYGALSNDKGLVTLSWKVSRRHEETLKLRWVESGGPRAKPSGRRGFGSQMIQFGLGESCVSEVTFPETGCQANFEFPIKKASED